MGLYHPLNGDTNCKYKLLCFLTPNKKISNRKALAFNLDRCCHLALCLWLILFYCLWHFSCHYKLSLYKHALLDSWELLAQRCGVLIIPWNAWVSRPFEGETLVLVLIGFCPFIIRWYFCLSKARSTFLN